MHNLHYFFYISLHAYTPCFYILKKDIITTIIRFSCVEETGSSSVYTYEYTCSLLLYQSSHLNLSLYRFVLLYQSLHLNLSERYYVKYIQLILLLILF